jgi:hypothetical protein
MRWQSHYHILDGILYFLFHRKYEVFKTNSSGQDKRDILYISLAFGMY